MAISLAITQERSAVLNTEDNYLTKHLAMMKCDSWACNRETIHLISSNRDRIACYHCGKQKELRGDSSAFIGKED
jgi:hypothetical protein